MDNPIKRFEKETENKLKEFDYRIKTSFVLIRQDLDEMKSKVEAMGIFLKKKDKNENYARKEDNKIRDKFRIEVDEFSQQISQLNSALDEVRKLKKEVVAKKDLALIEDKIRTSFKNDLEDSKMEITQLKSDKKELDKRISALELGYFKEKKSSKFNLFKSFKFTNKANQEDKILENNYSLNIT